MHNQLMVMPKNIRNFNFKFRESQMSEILNHLLGSKEQIVNVFGLCGMGKSALVKSTLHYVAQRKYFTGGILLIEPKEVRERYLLLSSIFDKIVD